MTIHYGGRRPQLDARLNGNALCAEETDNPMKKFLGTSGSNDSTLPKSEWEFRPSGQPAPANWQLNHWLNYEYARSSRKIVEAVLHLRSHQPETREEGTLPAPLKVPRFATYLFYKHRHTFPEKAWRDLPEAERSLRRFENGLGGWCDPFEEDILKVFDRHLFADSIARGEITLRDGPTEDGLAIFQINFQERDDTILKHFRAWLEQRRDELINQYKTQYHHVPPKEPCCLADAFKPAKRRVGRSRNCRPYFTCLDRLGALRALAHTGRWLPAYNLTWNGKKALYSRNQTAWDRARDEALDLMMRLTFAWEHSFFPPFVLNPMDYLHVPGPRILARPLLSFQSGSRSHIRKELLAFRCREFLDYRKRELTLAEAKGRSAG